ncbi:hypothetical protein PAXRUDRAFT_779143, partial [Paxillus rubicundulus Ve08.2h10]
TWNSTGATPIDSDEPGEHTTVQLVKKNQGFEISAFRYFGIYCPNMPQSCQTSLKMQWAVVWLSRFLDHEKIAMCLNMSTRSVL